MTAARPAKRSPCDVEDRVVHRLLRDGDDLRDWPVDPGDEIVDDDCPAAEECRVVLGARVVGADDEPLEVVHVWIEADRAGPLDRLARRGGRERPMEEQPPEAVVAGLGIARISAPW